MVGGGWSLGWGVTGEARHTVEWSALMLSVEMEKQNEKCAIHDRVNTLLVSAPDQTQTHPDAKELQSPTADGVCKVGQ